mmetsp:Transcript_11594/g.17144  ORF Transcript_11594/g.17144 Transcript_11594/m.17144 type:complete len:437 (+) Transcript_11594:82-1392(+)|eukprot:CAMPEP_0117419554 /NCGR_PEP_ID=MMETSP0758-20121206/1087_1 /TAXON_ID=63605 /ORGANISM="Percolomonas cosmopolitus, Strain AE-1 (ATCC 50343)" /LENGTH=436 /DNA_ID=CAMNT_0005200677 /DNA_START=58 /DNA_END=1368 /DNA_ORIENTATION=-
MEDQENHIEQDGEIEINEDEIIQEIEEGDQEEEEEAVVENEEDQEVVEGEEEEEEEGEEEDAAFQFLISDPSKSYHGKKLTFWVYKITTEVSVHDEYKEPEYEVRRRFSHFLWLRQQLVDNHPGCIVPPVPEKDFKGTLEKFVNGVDTKGLLEYRQRSLTKFLTRVGEHYILQKDEALHAFLTEEFNDFCNTIKTSSSKKSQSLGWFKKSLTHQLTWVSQQKKFVTDLEEALKQLKSKLEHMVRRRKDMSHAISEFGNAFEVLGTVEKMYEESALSSSLIEVSKKADLLSLGALSQAERETMQVIETLTYYLGMCDSIKAIIKRLDELRLEKDDATNTLRNNKASAAKAQKSGKPDKVANAEEKVAATQARLTEAEDVLNKAQECFRNDIDRFDMERRVDFQYMLRAFVALQIEYSNELSKSWETLLPTISTIQPV